MNDTQRNVLTDLVFSFIWNFKKGDNIIYNFEVLFQLYKSKKILNSKYLNKPTILIIAAIIECILDDFVFRVRQHVNDRIPNISLGQINDFRSKKLEKFEHYISRAIEFDLFDQTTSFYDDLKLLQDMRNRLHIQNSKYKLDKDEDNIFTNLNLSKSEEVLKIVLLKMCSKFPRRDIPETMKNSASDVFDQMITGMDLTTTSGVTGLAIAPPSSSPSFPLPDEDIKSKDCPYCLSGFTKFGELCPHCGNIYTTP